MSLCLTQGRVLHVPRCRRTSLLCWQQLSLTECLLCANHCAAVLSDSFAGPVDCGLPGSSVHGIFQARKMELPFPLPGDLPDLGLNQSPLCLLHWQVDSLSHQGSLAKHYTQGFIFF